MGTTIPNNTNLDSIINSIAENNDTINKITKIIFSSAKSLDKISINDLKNSIKQSKKISGLLIEYLDSINGMLSSLQTTSNMNLDVILGHSVDEAVNKDKIVKKDKYTNLEAIQQLGTVISGVSSSLKSIGDLNMGFFAIKELKIKIRVFGKLFQDMVSEIIDIFEETNKNDFAKITNILIGDPETVLHTINTTENKSEALSNMVKKESTKTKRGAPGLIDTMLKVFELIKFVNDYNLPNKSETRKKIKSIKNQLDLTMFLIYDSAMKYGKKDSANKLNQFAELFKDKDGIMLIVNKFNDINTAVANMIETSKNLSELKIIASFLYIMTSLEYMNNVLEDKYFKNVSSKEHIETLNDTIKNVNNLTKLSQTIVKLSIKFKLIEITSKILISGIDSIKSVIYKISEIIEFAESTNVSGNNVKILTSVIESLNETFNKLIRFGILAIAVNALMPSIMLGLLSMRLTLTQLENILAKELINNIGNNIDSIIQVFEKIETLSKLKINKKRAGHAIDSGIKILYKLVGLYNTVTVNKTDIEKSKFISNILDDTVKVFKKIAILGVYAVPVMFTSLVLGTKIFGKTVLSLTKNLIDSVTNIYSSIDDKKAKQANRNSRNILNIIQDTVSIFIAIIELGLLAVGVVVVAIPVVIGVAVARMVFGSISIFFKTIKNTKSKEKKSDAVLAIVNNMVDIFKALILIGLLAIPVILLSPIILAGLLVTAALVFGINLVLRAMMKSTKRARKATIYIALVGLIMLAIVGLCLLIIKAAEITAVTFTAMIIFAVAFIGMMIMIRLMLWVTKKVVANKESFKALFLIGLVIGGLLLITYMVTTLIEAANKIKGEDFLSILMLFGMILVIGALTTGLGFLCSLIMPIVPIVLLGLGALVVMIGALLLIVGELKLIEMINLNESKIKDNIKVVLNTIENIVKSIFGFDGEQKEGSTSNGFMDVIRKIGGALLTFIGVLASIPFLAAAVVSIGLITLLAGQLKLIELIELDSSKITTNVGVVINTARQVADAIFHNNDEKPKEQKEGGSLWSRFKEGVKDTFKKIGTGIGNMVGIIGSIPFLAASVMAIGLIVSLAESLKKLSEIKLTSAAIIANVTTVMDTAKLVSDKLYEAPGKEFKVNEGDNAFVAFFKRKGSAFMNASGIAASIPFLKSSVAAVSLLASLAHDLDYLGNKVKIKNEKNLTNNVDNIFAVSKSISDKVFDKNWKVPGKRTIQAKMDALTAINTLIKESVVISDKEADNNKKVVDNYIKFIDKVDKSKLDNLKSTAKIFEKMADFSKTISGNFDRLADTLNEKIGPMLEKIEEGISKIPQSVETGTANVSSSIFANAPVAARPQDQISMAAQVNRENPKMTKEEVEKVVDKRLSDQATNNDAMDSKLSDLINLFREGEAMVRVNSF